MKRRRRRRRYRQDEEEQQQRQYSNSSGNGGNDLLRDGYYLDISWLRLTDRSLTVWLEILTSSELFVRQAFEMRQSGYDGS